MISPFLAASVLFPPYPNYSDRSQDCRRLVDCYPKQHNHGENREATK